MAEWSKAIDSSSILFGGMGSNPIECNNYYYYLYLFLNAWMAEGSKAVDLSSILFGGVGSNPTSSNILLFYFLMRAWSSWL